VVAKGVVERDERGATVEEAKMDIWDNKSIRRVRILAEGRGEGAWA